MTKPTPNKIPYGFDLAADGVQLVPNADEQRVLELIASLRKDGYTLRDIADELTRRGIPTKGSKAAWQNKSARCRLRV